MFERARQRLLGRICFFIEVVGDINRSFRDRYLAQLRRQRDAVESWRWYESFAKKFGPHLVPACSRRIIFSDTPPGFKVIKPTWSRIEYNASEDAGKIAKEFGKTQPITFQPVALPFDINKHHLRRDAKDALQALKATIKALQQELGVPVPLHIFGHADRIGDEGFNYHLSERRVETVEQALQDFTRQGIIGNIVTNGCGFQFAPPRRHSQRHRVVVRLDDTFLKN